MSTRRSNARVHGRWVGSARGRREDHRGSWPKRTCGRHGEPCRPQREEDGCDVALDTEQHLRLPDAPTFDYRPASSVASKGDDPRPPAFSEPTTPTTPVTAVTVGLFAVSLGSNETLLVRPVWLIDVDQPMAVSHRGAALTRIANHASSRPPAAAARADPTRSLSSEAN